MNDRPMLLTVSLLLTLSTWILPAVLSPALAGSQDQAKVALHVQAHATGKGVNPCDSPYSPTIPCSQYVTAADLNFGADVYLVVGDGASEGVRGLSCGITYNGTPGSGADVISWIMCASGLQFPNSGSNGVWPAAGGGNRITWSSSDCQMTEIPPNGVHAVAGFFYVYAYSGDTFSVTSNQNLVSGPELTVTDCIGVESQLAETATGSVAFSNGGLVAGYNPCSGAGGPGLCSVSEEALDFGQLQVGDSRDLTLVVSNTAPLYNDPVVIDPQIDCTEFQIVSGSGETSIEPGQAHTITIRFSPTLVSSSSCLLSLGLSCPDVTLTGEGTEPAHILVSPVSLSQTLPSNETAMQILSIKNAGGTDLEWSVSVTGAAANMVSVLPEAGVNPASTSVDLEIRFDASGVTGGAYAADLTISSNDPENPQVVVPIVLTVVGIPDIALAGDEVVLESSADFVIAAAVTHHAFPITQPPDGGGYLDLVADGYFYSSSTTATAVAEGTVVGSVGGPAPYCTPVSGTFPLPAYLLASLAADGSVDVDVQNSVYVYPYCATNRHTVRLRYNVPLTQIDFATVYLGSTAVRTVTIRNWGTETLHVTGASSDNPDYTAAPGTLSVPPGGSAGLDVTFTPASGGPSLGTLTVASDDPDEPVLTVALAGEGILPPDIDVSPQSMTQSLESGDTAAQILTLSNVGAVDLEWTISLLEGEGSGVVSTTPTFTSAEASGTKTGPQGLPAAPPQESLYSAGQSPLPPGEAAGTGDTGSSLENLLAALDGGFASVTAAIPGRYDFAGGDVGYYIDDGGLDMYDGGNYLTADLSVALPYSDGTIVDSPPLGAGGRYFTRKYPGLFVFAADLGGTDNFYIVGNLGADGSGSVDGAVLETTVNGIHFRGFVKRVFGAGDPSVNHLIIVPDNPSAVQSFSTYTDDDFHQVSGLASSKQIFYLLYAGAGGAYIDNDATLDIMNAFISTLHLGPSWLSVLPTAGTTPPGGADDLNVVFDAGNLVAGDYTARILIASNDPDESRFEIPVQLSTSGTPNIALAGPEVSLESTVDYYLDGATTTHSLIVSQPPPSGGAFELRITGDYASTYETASLTVEGTLLGSVGGLGSDCIPGSAVFPVSAEFLSSVAADGHVDAVVTNSSEVGAFCLENSHTVRLVYRGTADNLDFGSLFVGVARTLSLTVLNTGTDVLTVSSLQTDDPVFTVTPGMLTIAPGDEAPVSVTFTPASAGAVNGLLTLLSDDPDQGTLQVPLTGEGVPPPVAGLSPDSLSASLLTGTQETQILTLGNTGGSPLEFTIAVISRVSPAVVTSSFAGISPGDPSISNNPAPSPESPSPPGGTDFIAASGDFETLPSSPVPLTCVVSDPSSGVLYAQQNEGTLFFRYRLATGAWDSLATCPLYSGNNGGAALLGDKVYTAYTGNPSTLGVYDIPTDSWTTIPNPLGAGTGNIASDGTYLYLAVSTALVRYDPATTQATPLAASPISFYPWGGLRFFAGKLYGHSGNGSAAFAAYDVAGDTWEALPPVPGGAVLGADVDPANGTYFAYGSYGGTNLYAYSLAANAWTAYTIPFFYVGDGGLAWMAGAMYFVAGEYGTGFARYITAPQFVQVTPQEGTVPGPGSLPLDVVFDATGLVGGDYAADIVVNSNDPVRPSLTVPARLSVTGAPDIRVSAAALDFGDVLLGDVADRELTVSNLGTADLTVSAVATDNPDFATDAASAFTLAPGASMLLTVSYTPAAAGASSGVLSVASDDPDAGTVEVLLSGTGVTAPEIAVSPASFTQSLFTGESATLALSIDNTAGGSVLLWTITVDGPDSGFVSVSPDSGSVPAGSAAAVDVVLDAAGLVAGVYSAQVAVHSNDPDDPLVQVPVELTVSGAPDIAVTGVDVSLTSTVNYVGSGAQTVHTFDLDVPPVAGGTFILTAEGDYGSSYETATLVVEGTPLGSVGGAGLDCTILSAQFPVTQEFLSAVAANGTINVLVTNSPDVDYFCEINRHQVELQYSTPGDRVDFGPVYIGESRSQEILVVNTGTDVLNVAGTAIDNDVFSAPAGSFSLNPGDSQGLSIMFTPDAQGEETGALTITSDDPDEGTLVLALTGEGISPPDITVTPDSLTVSLLFGDTDTRLLTLGNLGSSPLDFNVHVEPISIPGSVSSEFAGIAPRDPLAFDNPAPAQSPSPPTEPDFIAAAGDFLPLNYSPSPLTCVVSDPVSGFIYAQANQGTAFYRYRPSTDTWETLAPAPISSGNNGGAAVLGNIVYTAYTNNPYQLGAYDISTDTWHIVENRLGAGTADIAADGTYLYLAVGYQLVREDPVAGTYAALTSPPIYFQAWGGLRRLGTTLYGHEGNGFSGFAAYDIASNTWSVLPPMPGEAVAGAAVDPISGDYYAYGTYGGNNLYKYSTATGAWTAYTIPFFNLDDGGLGWLPSPPGIYFVQGEDGTGFARYELLPPFLTVSPRTGSVAGSSSTDLTAAFDARNVAGGDYYASVVISSNDPDEPEVAVPAHLHVTGAADIDVSPASLDFGSVFLGYPEDLVLTVSNLGSDVLTVSDISTDDPVFTVSAASLVLDVGESAPLTVTADPAASGPLSASLTLLSNDPDEASLTVPLTAVAGSAPVIGVSPEAVVSNLSAGNSETQDVAVSNSGGSDLEFQVSLQSVLPPNPTPGAKVAVHVQNHVSVKGVNICDPVEDGGSAPSDIPCSQFTTSGLVGVPQDIYVVVGRGDSLGVAGLQFGIDYNGAHGAGVDLITWSLCTGGLQFPSATWPQPESGNIVTWNVSTGCARTVVPPDGVHAIAGAFYVYAYGADLFQITEHRQLVSGPALKVANCLGVETQLDPETSTGAIAFSTGGALSGANPCQGTAVGGEPPSWLSVAPLAGTVLSGGTSVLGVTTNASGLYGGTYSAFMRVDSNDPVTSMTTVPVTLNVEGIPDIDVSPLVLDFGDVFSGGAASLGLTVHNVGSEDLVVNSVSADNPDFSVDGSGFTVLPGESTELSVVYTAGAAGPSSGVLSVSSNDPDEGTVTVALSGASVPGPVAGVDPDSLGFDLVQGAADTRTVTLSNTGASDLDFTISLGGSAGPSSPPTGGPKVAVHTQNHVVQKGVSICDPASVGGPAPTDIPCSQYNTQARVHSGQDIYIVVGQADSTGVGGVTFGIAYNNATGAGVDLIGSFYMCATGLQFPSATWPASGSGNVITWNTSTSCADTEIPPDGVHGIAGAFYVYAYSADVFQITEHTKQVFPALKMANCLSYEKQLDPETAAGSIAFSNDGSVAGANPCAGSSGGTGPPVWLSVDPTEGTVPAGDGVDLSIAADTGDLLPGLYSGFMHVNSNDPVNATLTVPVTMNVEGIPDIDVSPLTLDFGSVFSGTSSSLDLTIHNVGSDDLVVDSVSVDNPDFSVDGSGFTVIPGESTDLAVTFTAGAPGSGSGILSVSSNDPDEGTVTVALSGVSVPAPVAGVDPDSLSFELVRGAADTRTVTLSNTGGSDLDFTVSLGGGTGPSFPPTGGPKIAVHTQNHTVQKGVGICTPASEGGPAPTDIPCSQYNTAASIRSPQDIYIVVGQADSTGVGGVTFGIAYNNAAGAGIDIIGSFSLCATGLQFPSATWPASGSGNVISWNVSTSCADTEIPPDGVHGIAGAFYVYAYSADVFQITEHTKLITPALNMANCLSVQRQLDPETAAGSIAFSGDGSVAGANPCAGSSGSAGTPAWLSVDPAEGTVAAGDGLDLGVTADTGNLLAGPYSALMHVDSNDPVTPTLTVPVTVNIVDIPKIAFGAAGLDFGDVFVGAEASATLTVFNRGSLDLSVTSITPGLADYAVSPSSLSMAPGESTEVAVTFSPLQAGDRGADLTFVSNDPGSPHTLPLAGIGVVPPVMGGSPLSFLGLAAPGGSKTKTLTLCNTGGSPLLWTAANRPGNVLGSDDFGHVAFDSDAGGVLAFDWADVSGGGTAVFPGGGAVDDGSAGPFPIGFAFPYFGETFTEFRVCSNGWLSFSNDQTNFSNQALPSANSTVPENLLAVFWDDLVFDPAVGSGVFYQSDGSRLVVQFTNMRRFDSTIPPFYSFEVLLYPNGDIVYQYLTVGANPASATVGIQNGARDDGLQAAFNQAYLHDNLAVRFTMPAPWLSADPPSGTVAAGACGEIQVVLDAADLDAGDYAGELFIQGNDPENPADIAQVRFHVETVEATAADVEPNTVNAGTNGKWVGATVELPVAYDPADILLETVRVLGSVAADTGFTEYTDFNENEVADRKMRFDRTAFVMALPEGDSTEVVVTGEVRDQTVFEARDWIRIVRPHVLAPDGGETLAAGTWFEVMWETPTGWEDMTASLFYRSASSQDWIPIADGVAGTHYAWRVPGEAAEGCRLKVELHDALGPVGYDGSDGMFSITSGVTGIQETIPVSYALFQNMPNPFRGATVIRFALPEESPVSVSIFDVSGRRLRSLIDETMPAGTYDVTWDGRNETGGSVASGIYFYLMKTPKHRETKRMFLLR